MQWQSKPLKGCQHGEGEGGAAVRRWDLLFQPSYNVQILRGANTSLTSHASTYLTDAKYSSSMSVSVTNTSLVGTNASFTGTIKSLTWANKHLAHCKMDLHMIYTLVRFALATILHVYICYICYRYKNLPKLFWWTLSNFISKMILSTYDCIYTIIYNFCKKQQVHKQLILL